MDGACPANTRYLRRRKPAASAKLPPARKKDRALFKDPERGRTENRMHWADRAPADSRYRLRPRPSTSAAVHSGQPVEITLVCLRVVLLCPEAMLREWGCPGRRIGTGPAPVHYPIPPATRPWLYR